MGHESLIGLLAEPVRLRAFAAVVLGATSPAEVVSRTGDRLREVTAALRRLADGGLVATVDGALVARAEIFKETLREYSAQPGSAPLDPDRTRAAVLRAFVVDGRLVAIPAAQGRRRVVLEYLAAGFEPGV